MNEHRNMILAVVLSIVILMGYEFYTSKMYPPVPAQALGEQATPSKAPAGGDASTAVPTAPPSEINEAGGSAAPGAPQTAVEPLAKRAAVLAKGRRIKIFSPRLSGSISLKGARIDDLTLIDYRTEMDKNSAPIILLLPKGTPKAYFAEFGWVSVAGKAVPGPDTIWKTNSSTLGPDKPVTLTWDNGQGLRFSRTYALDENFMFTVTQKVVNTGSATAKLNAFGLVSRRETPKVTGYYILHEGLLGVFDGTLNEVKYKDIQEKGIIKESSTGGWIGITDKYWLAALIPNPKTRNNSRFVHRRVNGTDSYQVDFLGETQTVAPGKSVTSESHFFAGAKEVRLLDAYGSAIGIDRFDLSIDFGWFYFLTKPIFYALITIEGWVGNFGIAILLLTVAIKLLFYPLANKSYTAMSKMKKLQPKMKEMRERFGDDKARLNQEMMSLYKKEKVNPASGCLPMLIQIPVFFSLYKVLFVTIEMRHAPFYGWINDLSARDPTSVFNLFGLIPWTPPDFLMIGLWPLIMGITMWLQQRLNPQPADPMQAKIFAFLPILFTFLLARFPAGLVIYWAWNNLLTIIQQKTIMIRMGVK